ncbi:MAG: hypothetical protein KC912_25375 [Proteobacteria bacterium]|nr:hypothetical protein [Pseudomonadota bacterium]
MQLARHLGQLSAGGLGIGLSTAVAWAGISSGLEMLLEVTWTVEDVVALAIAEVLFAALVIVASVVCAGLTAGQLTPTLDRWLQLAATGHPHPPAGASAPVALLAHATFTLLAAVVGVLVLRAGLVAGELNWTVEGLLLLAIGGLLGGVGALPWGLAALRGPTGHPADEALVEAGEEGLLLLLAASTLSVGGALALLGWLPMVLAVSLRSA